MRERFPKNTIQIILAFLLILSIYIGIILFSGVLDKFVNDSELAFLISSALGSFLIIFIFCFINKTLSNFSFVLSFDNINKHNVTYIILFFAFLQIGICFPLYFSDIIPSFGIPMLDGLKATPSIYVILTTIILVPIFEEIIFRGIILKNLLRNKSFGYSIIASSMLFSLVHTNPAILLSAFILGLLLAWIYSKTNNLLLSIIGHAVYNLTASILTYIFIDNLREFSFKIYGKLTIPIIAISLILLLVLFLKRSRLLKINLVNK